ncbi:uncharacterized protein N7498_001771 [Penicillium cinerascens]|uniref:Zn(2)-C6 fungal-type domain-containing protein n=1 Tax=Penicillium cinerascens TaxID=70096 RepID=A0A9W9NAG9_9EURO|nr:uncharacterized protein N7498_001771 [Penicillium cinerascens]KAJ5215364.1 hypothetical protein N7498_001771 [Penicillium cinerascens]
MFSTFSANLNSTDRPSEKPAAAPRPKRNQVVRACDWCRLNRIKCDDKQPCQNCRNHGGYCSNTKQFEAPSLPAANREIHRLRNRLKDYQEQLDKVTEESKRHATDAESPSRQSSNASNSTSPGIAFFMELPHSHRKTWDGLQKPESRTGRLIHYGPLSSSYMVMRLNRYMSESFNQLHLKSLLPVRLSQLHRHSPTVSQEQLSDEMEPPSLRLGLAEVEDLSREQEEHFLVLLWQAYHCMYPIVAEEEFREYYGSLWAGTNGQAPRQPSALVDSLLAVCMQYGSTFLVDDEDVTNGETETQAAKCTTAAHTFYRRSQRALMESLEHPSIPSLQSHIYCIIYLYNTANLDTGHALLGLAIRVAQMLRLHIRPLGPLPKTTQELYSRIWWTLYQLDSQISMTLGRPPLINPNEVGCAIPTDMGDAVQLSPTVLISPPEEEIGWLSFHVQYIRLMAAARGVNAAFGARCAEVLQTKNIQDIHEDPPTLELLGSFLGSGVRAMYDWVQTVPRSLKNQRKGSGEAFSTDRTSLNLNPASPLWLQRQRLLLEIIYHHLQIATFRPFIRFPPRGASLTPLSDSHSISALNHAVVVTNILNQVLSETDLLCGWTPAFQYQWDATICILSFVVANPVCPPTPAARKILPMALRNLDTLGQSFTPVANTIQVAWEQFRSSSTPRGWSQLTPPSQSASDTAVLPPVSVRSSTGIITTTRMPSIGPGVITSTSQPIDPFSALLTPTNLPSNMMLGNDFSDPATITPPLDFMDTSFNLPSDLLVGTGTQWMSNGAMSLDSWEEYGSQ